MPKLVFSVFPGIFVIFVVEIAVGLVAPARFSNTLSEAILGILRAAAILPFGSASGLNVSCII